MALPSALRRELVNRIRDHARPLDPMPTDVSPVLHRLPDVRAVLFDLYGTLLICGVGGPAVHAEAARASAMAAALCAAGWGSPTPEEAAAKLTEWNEVIRSDWHQRREAGIQHPEVDIREIWRRVLADRLQPVTDEAIARAAVHYEMQVNPVWVMPGLGRTLWGLKRMGKVLGLVSNAQFYSALMFEAVTGQDFAGWGFDEDLCVWSFELGEAKPSVRLFQRALEGLRRRYGITPGETLVVGNDAVCDVEPAVACGCRTALLAADRRCFRPVGSNGNIPETDLVLTSLDQLLTALRSE